MITGSAIRENRNCALVAVRQKGSELEHVSEQLRDDKEVVLAAVTSDSWALQFASDRLKADREIVLEAVTGHTSWSISVLDCDGSFPHPVLGFASEELRGDREVVLAAVKCDPLALEHMSPAMLNDREVMLTAFRSLSPVDLEFASIDYFLGLLKGEWREDGELILELVRVDPCVLTEVCPVLRQNKDFLLQAWRSMNYFGNGYDSEVGELEGDFCYTEVADGSIRAAISLEKFQGAVDSVLALPGSNTPILTVTFEASEDQRGLSDSTCRIASPETEAKAKVQEAKAKEAPEATPEAAPEAAPAAMPTLKTPSTSFDSCRATLVSGTSFACSLLGVGGKGELDEKAEQQPAQKRRRFASSRQGGAAGAVAEGGQPKVSSMTVGELAKLLREELRKHVQSPPGEHPLDHIFVAFEKPGDDSVDQILVTPWEWDRPISDFW